MEWVFVKLFRSVAYFSVHSDASIHIFHTNTFTHTSHSIIYSYSFDLSRKNQELLKNFIRELHL